MTSARILGSAPMARQLDAALAKRDGARASDISYTLLKIHRERAAEALRREREGVLASQSGSAAPGQVVSTAPIEPVPEARAVERHGGKPLEVGEP